MTQRTAGIPMSAPSRRDLMLLCVLTIPGISALVGASTVLRYGYSADFWSVYRTWVSSAGLGNLFVAPVVIYSALWVENRGWRDQNTHALEHLGVLILIALVSVASSVLPALSGSSIHFVVFLSLPLLIWSTVREGIWGAVTAASVLVLTTVHLTAAGYGPFTAHHLTPSESILQLQSYLGTVIIACLFTALAVEKLERSESALKTALAHQNSLLSVIPDQMFELDADGRYLNVWASSPGELAAKPPDLLCRTVKEALPADTASQVMSALQEAEDQGQSYGHQNYGEYAGWRSMVRAFH